MSGAGRNGWQGELARAARDAEGLARRIRLSAGERRATEALRHRWPVQVTPGFLALMASTCGAHLRRQVVPAAGELRRWRGEHDDPLTEEPHQVAPGLILRYPDRALLLVTGQCTAYCRFCTRKRLAGLPPADLDPALRCLTRRRQVREVILSGGDPLTLSDRRLGEILGALRRIRHIRVLRVGTRAPVFLPSRITPSLVRLLAAAGPLYVLVHVNHPDELHVGFNQAVSRLIQAGIPVLSQTVLLRGINDRASVLARLFRGLSERRIRPYYLHHCDPAPGTRHFRVPVARGRRLVRELRAQVSGLCMPSYVRDDPSAPSKIPLA